MHSHITSSWVHDARNGYNESKDGNETMLKGRGQKDCKMNKIYTTKYSVTLC